MTYPSSETYDKLYAKYVTKRADDELLDLMEPLNNTVVLDLCAGAGRLSAAALARGASRRIIVDSSPEMLETRELQLGGDTDTIAVVSDVLRFLRDMSFVGAQADRVVCRQAITYWLDRETADLLESVIPANGTFVFNTFNTRPSERPKAREYELDGHNFAEISWRVGDEVHHLQIRNGLDHHFTKFSWIPTDEITAMLSKGFVVEEIIDGKTSLFRCTRRSE